jgi:hypothetical protein
LIEEAIFCQGAPPEAQAVVRSHLQRVTEELRRAVPGVVAIYLSGGFGRGEGSVAVSEGGWRPLNDYDVWTVVEDSQRLKGCDLGPLRASLVDEFRMDGLDLPVLDLRQLRGLGPTLENYEFLHAARLIYGQEVRGRELLHDVSSVPLYEFVRLVCNRAAGILTSFTPGWAGNAAYRQTQYVKAGIAVGDTLVFLHGSFQPRYRDRRDQLPEVFEKCEYLHLTAAEQLMIQSSYQQKLNARESLFEHDHKIAAGILLKAYVAVADREMLQPCASAEAAASGLLAKYRRPHSPKSPFRRVASLARSRYRHCPVVSEERRLRILLSMPLLNAAFDPSGGESIRVAFLSRFWWLPEAMKCPWTAGTAAMLWENYCH